MKLSSKLLVIPAAISFLGSSTAIALEVESNSSKGFGVNSKRNSTLIAQAGQEDPAGKIKITVTGTKTPRKTTEYPGSVTVLEGDEINSNQTPTLRNLFKDIPGVSTKKRTRSGINWIEGQEDVNIRGMEGDRVLMQVDGIKLPTYYYSGYWNFGRGSYVDFNTLKSVEILKGPASTLYGSDALGGVITFKQLSPSDLLTPDEKYSFDIPAYYDGSNSGTGQAIKLATKLSDNLSGLFILTNENAGDPSIKADDKYINGGESSGNTIFTNLEYQFNDFSKGNFVAENINKSTDEDPTKSANLPAGHTYLDSETDTETTRYSISYVFDNPSNQKFLQYSKVKAYIQDIKVDNIFTSRRSSYGRPVDQTRDQPFEHSSFGAELQLRSDREIGNNMHKITYGIDFSKSDNERLRKVTNNTTKSVDNLKDTPDSEITRTGIYLQDEIEVNKNLDLIAGIRFDNFDLDAESDAAYIANGTGVLDPKDYSESAFSPKLSAIYKVNPSLSIYGLYARGFKAPTYVDINSSFTNTRYRYETLSNPDLKPETSDTFEIGMRKFTDKFDWNISGYLSKYDDFIDQFTNTGRVNGMTQYKSTNKDEVEIYGTEISGEYRFNPDSTGISLIGSLAYAHGENTKTDEALDSIEPLTAIAILRYKTSDNKVTIDLKNTHVGGPRVESGTTTFVPDAYNKVDLVGNLKQSERLEFDLGVYNLFDERYYYYSDVKALSKTAANLEGYSQPSRHIKAGFNFRF